MHHPTGMGMKNSSPPLVRYGPSGHGDVAAESEVAVLEGADGLVVVQDDHLRVGGGLCGTEVSLPSPSRRALNTFNLT